MLRMTAEEYRAFCVKSGQRAKNAPGFQGEEPKKPTKHRNIKVYVYEDGLVSSEKLEGHGGVKEKYDSRKEYHRCLELRLLEKAGRISDLQRQTPLLISSAFVDSEGKKHQEITYRADFIYMEDGREVVEDVKGYSREKQQFLCTEAFRLKWKMLQKLYPEKVFRLY